MAYTIQPTSLGIAGEAVAINVAAGGFAANATSCQLFYNLVNEANEQIYTGVILLTGQDFAGWGQDNYYLVQYTCTTLGLTLIGAEFPAPPVVEPAPKAKK
jgi:hypothetical protein